MIYNDIEKYLKLEYKVIPIEGDHIDINEIFKIEFKVKNEAPPDDENPVVFRNLHLAIKGSVFAKPVKGDTTSLPLPCNELAPEDEVVLEAEFQALAALEGSNVLDFLLLKESLIRVTIHTEVRFFFRKGYTIIGEIRED